MLTGHTEVVPSKLPVASDPAGSYGAKLSVIAISDKIQALPANTLKVAVVSVIPALLNIEDFKMDMPFLFDSAVPWPEPDVLCLQHVALAFTADVYGHSEYDEYSEYVNHFWHCYKAATRGYKPMVYKILSWCLEWSTLSESSAGPHTHAHTALELEALKRSFVFSLVKGWGKQGARPAFVKSLLQTHFDDWKWREHCGADLDASKIDNSGWESEADQAAYGQYLAKEFPDDAAVKEVMEARARQQAILQVDILKRPLYSDFLE